MAIDIKVPDINEFRPKITVFGVGGAGGNAVNNMIESNLQGVSFVVANTDAQALEHSLAIERIQLGHKITRGLGAGACPHIGEAAAEESEAEINKYLEDCNMVFITAGMGGGTGTGAAPVIARCAREKGILTVGVVTKPFLFEGCYRMKTAETGIEQLHIYCDTLIVIPNQNLFRIANEKTTFNDAFSMADDVLHSGVRGVTDLIVMPGLINLDFADIRTVMSEMGKAMMGTGESNSDNRAQEAAEAAISNPLLDNISMKGARGVLINITGGSDIKLYEVDEAANRIREEVDDNANIIFGSTFDSSLEGTLRVSVIATGIESEEIKNKTKEVKSELKIDTPEKEEIDNDTQESKANRSYPSYSEERLSNNNEDNNRYNNKKKKVKKKGIFASLFSSNKDDSYEEDEDNYFNSRVNNNYNNHNNKIEEKVLIDSEGGFSNEDDKNFDIPAFLRKRD